MLPSLSYESEGGQRYKVPMIRNISSGAVMVSVVPTVNIVCIYESCRETRYEKFSSQKETNWYPYEVMNVD